jgi:hypothetical protein
MQHDQICKELATANAWRHEVKQLQRGVGAAVCFAPSPSPLIIVSSRTYVNRPPAAAAPAHVWGRAVAAVILRSCFICLLSPHESVVTGESGE